MTIGAFKGLEYSSLGEFQIDGLKITGQAHKLTAQNWSGSQSKEGYFLAIHADNAKKFATKNQPAGKDFDESGDVMILLGGASPSMTYIDITDNHEVTDRYSISVTAAD